VGCALAAAAVVALDAFFSAQQGYLARPPDYDGVGYMNYAETPYHQLLQLHPRAALAGLDNIAPLWTAVLAVHYLVAGDGPYQAFASRFWPVFLLLLLVYWVVRARAPRALAAAAVVLTGLLPVVSAGVRSSSWELFSGMANYNDDWGLDDLRPDIFAAVLLLWAVALLVENSASLRRSDYLLSAAFAAAALLMKPSVAPVTLAVWAAALLANWRWNRRDESTRRLTVHAVLLFGFLLLPWATVGGGLHQLATYAYEVVFAYRSAYSLPLSLSESLAYYPARLPGQLGQVEALPVIAGSLLLVVFLARQQWLGRAELTYAALAVLFYIAFTLTSNKNPHVGEWITLALWLFALAGLSRVAAARWPAAIERASTRALASAAAYVLILYAAGGWALWSWPSNEQRANAQLLSVTSGLAGEIKRNVSPGECFSYAPGPGWPASLEMLMTTSDGRAPRSTAIDVDPTTTAGAYLDNARKCPVIVVYRNDIKQVAKAFFCPPVRQPYLQALSDWVRTPGSGYRLDRSWRLEDLPPVGPHTLGRYEGVSLTLDMYVRSAA
jgi:hypothetical protein